MKKKEKINPLEFYEGLRGQEKKDFVLKVKKAFNTKFYSPIYNLRRCKPSHESLEKWAIIFDCKISDLEFNIEKNESESN